MTEAQRARRANEQRLLKALDYSAVGSIVRQQVDLWNDTRRIAAKFPRARFARRSPSLRAELPLREGWSAARLRRRRRNRGPARAHQSQMSSQRVTRSRPDSFEA